MFSPKGLFFMSKPATYRHATLVPNLCQICAKFVPNLCPQRQPSRIYLECHSQPRLTTETHAAQKHLACFPTPKSGTSTRVSDLPISPRAMTRVCLNERSIANELREICCQRPAHFPFFRSLTFPISRHLELSRDRLNNDSRASRNLAQAYGETISIAGDLPRSA